MRNAFQASLGILTEIAGCVAALQGSPMAPAMLAIGLAIVFDAFRRSHHERS